jgi:hypothetical protein
MNRYEATLVEEYASAGNGALLLARLEREHRQMLREMRAAEYRDLTALASIRPSATWAGHTRGVESCSAGFTGAGLSAPNTRR